MRKTLTEATDERETTLGVGLSGASQTSLDSPSPERDPRLELELIHTYHELAGGLFQYALHLSRQREAAEDILQEVFLRYFQALQAGEEIRNQRAWLYKVTRNCFLASHGRMVRQRETALEASLGQLDEGQRTPEDHYHSVRLLEEIYVLLSPRETEIVKLRAEGLGYSEIAETLGIRSGTVGALLARAVEKCRSLAG